MQENTGSHKFDVGNRRSRHPSSLRISRIPSTLSDRTLQQILNRLTVNGDDTNKYSERPRDENIQYISLAPAPYNVDSNRYKVATVTFRKTPDNFKGCEPRTGLHKRVLEGIPDQFEVDVDCDFEGFTPLYCSPNPLVDIIAVTGLAGHAFGSWRSPKGPEMWLRDFLPDCLHGKGYEARILTYGYDTKLVGSTSTASVLDLSKQFLQLLKCIRQPEGQDRPIIFIGHSLGGLIIKQALRQADYQPKDPQNHSILESCHGMLMFGVPNRGLENAQLVSAVKGQPNDRLVRDLGGRSQFLEALDQEFSRFFRERGTRIISFYETGTTRTIEDIKTGTFQRIGSPVLMVPRESAIHYTGCPELDAGTPIDTDHSMLVKYSSHSDKHYTIVRERILELVKVVPEYISRRFGAKVKDHISKGDRQRLLQSLVPEDNDPTLRRPPGKNAHPGTCQWILENENFLTWQLSSPYKLFWISGPPGTGKTVLASYVLDHLSKDSHVIYFFCDDKHERQRTALEILKSLVFQLLHHDMRLFKHMMDINSLLRKGERPVWSFDTLWTILGSIIRDADLEPVYCLLDAMDECEETDEGEVSRNELLNRLANLYTSDTQCRMRLMITSRPEVDIRRLLGEFDTIVVGHEQPMTQHDIHQLISERLGHEFGDRFSPELISKVTKRLQDDSRGMFLWVALVIKDLSSCFSDADVYNRLESLPKGLYAYYDSVLSRILPEDRPRAKAILMWVVYAPEPLALQELNCALAISRASTIPTNFESIERYKSNNLKLEIEQCCKQLISIRPSGDGFTVHLTHQSVKDYFTTQTANMSTSNTHRKDFYTPLKEANGLIAATCITCATFTEGIAVLQERRSRWLPNSLSSIPFFGYSIRHWGIYTQSGVSLYPQLSERVLALELLLGQNFSLAVDLKNEHFSEPILHIATRLGSLPLIQFLMENGADPNALDKEGCTSLGRAAYSRNEEVFRYLLASGGDAKKVALSDDLTTPAWDSSSVEVIAVLLVQNGTDTNYRDPRCDLTPLLRASVSSQHVLAKALLQHGADPSVQDSRGNTALIFASTRFPIEVLRLFIEKGADINHTNHVFISPITMALLHGNIEIFKFFMSQKPPSKGMIYTLSMAISKLSTHATNMLLEAGVSVNCTDVEGLTPLKRAIDVPQFAVSTRDGFDDGANIPRPFVAPRYLHDWDSMVELLLKKKADARSLDIRGQLSMLHQTPVWACQISQDERNFCWQPIYGMAMPGGYMCPYITEGVLLRLVKGGIDIDQRGEHGYTLFHHACRLGWLSLIDPLMERGALVNLACPDKKLPIHLASQELELWYYDSGARELKKSVTGFESKSEGYTTGPTAPKSDPIYQNYCLKKLIVVEVLVHNGADLNARDGMGNTPLHLAVYGELEETVQWLVENGADINLLNNDGKTPLDLAVQNNQTQIARILVEVEPDMNIIGRVSSLEEHQGRRCCEIA